MSNKSKVPPRLGLSPPSVGDRLVYAVGDIHGRLDLLNQMMAEISADIEAAEPQTPPLLIFLGDYIDRGPNSRGVLTRLISLQQNPFIEVACLLGNHEELLLQCLVDPGVGPAWWQVGGGETLGSYGLGRPAGASRQDWAELGETFAAVLPAAHLLFLKGLALTVVVGDYAFVHAGVRPGVPLKDQSRRDMLWIRDDFLSDTRTLEKVIVHGHTPVSDVHIDARRIGLDTGAYASGILSAIRLEDDLQRVIQVSALPP